MIRHAILPLIAAVPLFAADWAVDPVHSTALFRIHHFGASYVIGRFEQVAGTVAFDPANDATGSVAVTIQAASVSTANQKRDDHLRSPDFFDARQFPTLGFTSTAWKKTGDGQYEVTGDLSIHGVTKPVTVTATRSLGKNPMNQQELLGFEAEFTIKRSDFGMAAMVGPIADEVRITVEIEANQKK